MFTSYAQVYLISSISLRNNKNLNAKNKKKSEKTLKKNTHWKKLKSMMSIPCLSHKKLYFGKQRKDLLQFFLSLMKIILGMIWAVCLNLTVQQVLGRWGCINFMFNSTILWVFFFYIFCITPFWSCQTCIAKTLKQFLFYLVLLGTSI